MQAGYKPAMPSKEVVDGADALVFVNWLIGQVDSHVLVNEHFLDLEELILNNIKLTMGDISTIAPHYSATHIHNPYVSNNSR